MFDLPFRGKKKKKKALLINEHQRGNNGYIHHVFLYVCLVVFSERGAQGAIEAR